MKIVYSACYGGYGLSEAAVLRYAELAGIQLYPEKESFYTDYYLTPPTGDKQVDDRRDTFETDSIERHDALLVRVVEELGEKANSRFSKLTIYETDSRMYRIDEYDGYETVKTGYSDDSWVIV
jgi:hypothetical protein